MAAIIQRTYAGMAPSANPKTLPENMGPLVLNLDLRYGDFRPLPQPAQVGQAAAGGTLYKLETGGGFITRPGQVNFVRGQIPTDTTERTYYTGDGAPKATDKSGQVRQLGVPSASAAPQVVVNEVAEYSTDDATSDQAKTQAYLLTAVRSKLVKSWGGASDAKILGSFTSVPPEVPQGVYSFNIPGNLVGGQFTPTNPSHANLISDELGFYLTVRNGVEVGNVDIDVRGHVTKLADDFKTYFPFITDPINSSPGRIRRLTSADDVDTIYSTLQDAMGSADSVLAANSTTIDELLTQFITTANSGSAAVAANVPAVTAFYQRADVVSAIDAAVKQAVSAIFSALYTYNNASYTTNPSGGGSTGGQPTHNQQ